MNPWFVTGFSDGESCFCLSIVKNKAMKHGYRVQVIFSIELHLKDKALLEQIYSYFGVGEVVQTGSELIRYHVRSIKELKVLINHFDSYPLITQKFADYQLWKQAINIIQEKRHLTLEGLKQLVAIRASINKGLSPELKAAFIDVIPVKRLIVKDRSIPDPNWLVGFVSGEGCFHVSVSNSSTNKLGIQVRL